MKYKIVLATLTGCKSCQALKDLLSANQIKFVEVPCDKDPGMCDQLEKITGKSHYPMAIIKDLTQNLDYVYFTSFNYNELGKENLLDQKVRTVAFFSQEDIVKKIKSI
jgi:glutaredoxin